ncbi:MAG: phage shock protein PspA [Candidatus Hydrogenedentes bacterium]|nr:phage shock protein PspA [Candidatus Hydrogenedentota bacterium]
MGIFTRVSDIISSNINAMLDKAEDPEKMVKLMIREMEDTLIEIKANCAGAMATKKKIQREMESVVDHAKNWEGKAQLAIDKGREDLAREALKEKRRYVERGETLENELDQAKALIQQYQNDIMQLEDKLGAAREKQRILIQRHRHAQNKKRAEQGIRKFDTSDAFFRFDEFQQRIDRMEAEGELVNYARKPTLSDEFAALEGDEDIERELTELKQRKAQAPQGQA